MQTDAGCCCQLLPLLPLLLTLYNRPSWLLVASYTTPSWLTTHRYMHPLLSALVGGVLPFGAVFIELFFILTSVWLHQFYYLFGFLALVFVILCLTCAEIAIVLCYFQLCTEDYSWWWRSYLTSGASAIYLLAYSAFYFFTKLDITKVIAACFA